MRCTGAAVLIAVSLTTPTPLEAQAFRSLGFIDPEKPDRYSQAHGVSGDGTTVVGESNQQAFRWRVAAPQELEPLGSLPNGLPSAAHGASSNGSVVVGWASAPGGSAAFRWVEGIGMTSLGTLGGTYATARAVTADGSVVIGGSDTGGNGSAFRWTSGSGMVALPSLPFPDKPKKAGYAWDISDDGTVIVGYSGCCANTQALMPVRWSQTNGFMAEGLGDLPGTDPTAPWGVAAGVSADGQVIAGGGGAPQLAFRWAGGSMSALGPTSFPKPHYPAGAMDASGDGSVIVGAAPSVSGDPAPTPVGPVPGARAFVWTAADGIRDLKQVLSASGLGPPLHGWTLEIATAVSDDGNIIAGTGTHNGRREAWVAALDGTPFPSTVPDRSAPSIPRRFLTIFAGLHESNGFLWSPTEGPQPIDPDPPPFLIVELMAFGLAPAGEEERIESIAFTLENGVGLDRDAWTDIALVVDANANGSVDRHETATVGGPGYVDGVNRVVFLRPFDLRGRTHYVLRAGIRDLGRDARVTVALHASGVAARSTAAQGSVVRHMSVGDRPGVAWRRIAATALLLGAVAGALIYR